MRPPHEPKRSFLAPAGKLLAAALLAAGVAAGAALAAHGAASAAPAARDTAATIATSYTKVGKDRSYKCDLTAALSAPPQVVVFGGSRAERFRPSDLYDATALTGFNAGLHNGRPEDWWALSSFFFRRAPLVPLRVIFTVQATTFSDAPLHPGLLYDRRLSRAFPASLIAAQKALQGPPPARPGDLLANKRYSSRGLLLWNEYDRRFAAGAKLSDIIAAQLPGLLRQAANTARVTQTRSHLYFEKTIKLFNAHGVVPVIVIMPYHPTALKAMLAVGWGVKEDRLKRYLTGLATRCRFETVDLLDIATFGGSADEFYDCSHPTMENSRRIIDYVVAAEPACFGLTPSPSPSPSGSPSP